MWKNIICDGAETRLIFRLFKPYERQDLPYMRRAILKTSLRFLSPGLSPIIVDSLDLIL